MQVLTYISSWHKRIPKELTINLLLWVLYFVGIAYQNGAKNGEGGETPFIQWTDIAISSNYFLVVMGINYVLLPHFFYNMSHPEFCAIRKKRQ